MMENNDLLFVKVQAIEKYASFSMVPPPEVVKLFKARDVFTVLEKHYDVLHTQSPEYLTEYVEDIIRRADHDQRH